MQCRSRSEVLNTKVGHDLVGCGRVAYVQEREARHTLFRYTSHFANYSGVV